MSKFYKWRVYRFRYLWAFLICGAVLVSFVSACPGYDQEAELLTGEAYWESLIVDIRNAKASIDVAMYFIIANPRKAGCALDAVGLMKISISKVAREYP